MSCNSLMTLIYITTITITITKYIIIYHVVIYEKAILHIDIHITNNNIIKNENSVCFV